MGECRATVHCRSMEAYGTTTSRGLDSKVFMKLLELRFKCRGPKLVVDSKPRQRNNLLKPENVWRALLSVKCACKCFYVGIHAVYMLGAFEVLCAYVQNKTGVAHRRVV